MTLARLLRCQPFGTSGLDFVPDPLPAECALVYAVALRALARDQSRPAGTHSGAAAGRSCLSHPPALTSTASFDSAYLRSSAGVSNRSEHMVALTFPDGARRDYPDNTTGLDIAKGISPSLAKRTVAMALDGKLADLADPIEHDAKIEFLTRDDPRALELIRHDAAHVLAEAVQTLWPGTQVTIGPVIDNGFYYDFFRNQPFTPEDFVAIEKKMREIIARDKPFTKEVWSRDEAKKIFRDKGELFKVELVDAIPGRPADKNLQAGRLVRSLPRPAHDLDRQDRQRVQADESRRRLLARRFRTAKCSRASTAPRLPSRRSSTPTSSRSRRPRSATTASSAARWICFTSRKKRPARCSGIPKGWTLFQTLENYIRRRQTDAGYAEVNAPQLINSSLWVASGHMATFREGDVPGAAARGGRAHLRRSSR